ncbi:MAG: hypothetical protein SGARI_000895 [Bacillariaceae sp.]
MDQCAWLGVDKESTQPYDLILSSSATAKRALNKRCIAVGVGSAVSTAELPPGDILLGRGVPMQRHPGNIRMHQMINSYRERYQMTSRTEKAAIIQEVLQQLKGDGSKFRKRRVDSDLWEEARDQAAYDKISHGA